MTTNTQAVGGSRRIVTVRLGKEVYGFPIETIEGIVPWEPPTHVPATPFHVAGVVSIRGSVLEVIDLRARLALERDEPTPSSRIVIAHIGERRAGLIVDSVDQVTWVPDACVDRECHASAAGSQEFIEGVARLDDALVLLLRTESLLSDPAPKRQAA